MPGYKKGAELQVPRTGGLCAAAGMGPIGGNKGAPKKGRGKGGPTIAERLEKGTGLEDKGAMQT